MISLNIKSMLKYFVSKIKYLKISSLPDTVMIVSPLYSTFSKHLAKNISIKFRLPFSVALNHILGTLDGLILVALHQAICVLVQIMKLFNLCDLVDLY